MIPIIFASSVLYIPVLLSNIIPWTGFRNFVNNQPHADQPLLHRSRTSCSSSLFTFFYVYVAFDPHQQADIIRKQGGYIPGIRPGPADRALPRPHPEPDHRARARCSWPSVAVAAVAPDGALEHQPAIPFYGTTLLIAVGVALETMRQIDSQLMMRNYEGFLK